MPERRQRAPSGAWLALIAAWLVVLGTLGGLLGYAYLGAPDEAPAVSAGREPAGDQAAEAPGTQASGADAPAEEGTAGTDGQAERADAAAAPDEAAGRGRRAETGGNEPEAPETAGETGGPGSADTAPAGLPAWRRHAAAAPPAGDPRPRIAVAITGLGLSRAATEAAIERLPAAMSLSFSPYAESADASMRAALADGHEVLLDLPMESAAFPAVDPGPQGLLTSLPPEDNLARLRWILGRGETYVGLAAVMGSRFLRDEAALTPVLAELERRGLMFLDNGSSAESAAPAVAARLGLPFARAGRLLDEDEASGVVIEARLAKVERLALADGYAVAVARPLPVTIESLAAWTEQAAERGFALVPVSSVAAAQRAAAQAGAGQ